MAFRMTRDSMVLWLLILSSIFAYFHAEPIPPTEWPWHEWTKFVMFLTGVFLGHLQTSPLPSSAEVKREQREDKEQ